MRETYCKKLNELDARMASIGYMQALMGWDSMTLASKKGIDARSAVSANISELTFTTLINDEVKHMLDELNSEIDALDHLDRAKLTYYTKAYHQIAKIPVEEYANYSALCAKSNLVWEEAKEKNDFAMFAPYLKEILDTQKRFVNYRGFSGHPYNTLLDDYEPGLTVEIADQFFRQLKEAVVPLVHKIQEKSQVDLSFLQQKFSIKDQEAFSKYLMEVLGFRMESGTIAVSAHPFTINLSREDVRITTHYYEDNLVSSIFSTIHETGHALYEQNISSHIGLSALSSGVSMGIHESQSRIYENNFGRSLSFWKAHYPKLQELFPELKAVSLSEFHRALNTVAPSLIRIEADEVTYPLHIMVRYEME
ncbi:MAG: carboxypeptidase M32, partial [Vallitaleaceae bacterium]|nr:carboxypeptidase M32 [Vallitaleaceae bacterium]